MRRLIGLGLSVAALTAGAAHPITIWSNGNCRMGFITDSVTVYLGSEQHSFNLSCKFYNSEDFKTKDGVTCSLESGMCSGFLPAGEVRVTCRDGSYGTASIACP